MLHHDRFFINGVYICTAICVLLGISTTLLFILQCIPAPVFWNRVYLMFPGAPANGPTEGYCMDQVAHVVVPVVLDLVTEIAIMLLPSRLLWNLRLPLKKKIGLTVTFSLGIFVSATNIVRIVYYAQVINGGDLAWDDIDAFIWTIVCMCFAVVCSSIPPCAPLLKVWSRRTRSEQDYSGSVPLTDRSEVTSRQSGRMAGKTEPTGGLIISRNDEWMIDSESVGDDGVDLYNSTHGVDQRWNSLSA